MTKVEILFWFLEISRSESTFPDWPGAEGLDCSDTGTRRVFYTPMLWSGNMWFINTEKLLWKSCNLLTKKHFLLHKQPKLMNSTRLHGLSSKVHVVQKDLTWTRSNNDSCHIVFFKVQESEKKKQYLNVCRRHLEASFKSWSEKMMTECWHE